MIDLQTGVETPHGKHKVFLPMNDDPAPPWVWNKANVQSVGGGFLVVDGDPKIDALRFYAGARTGTSQVIPTPSHLVDHISPIFSPFFPFFARFHRLAETVPTSHNPGPRAKKQPAQVSKQ